MRKNVTARTHMCLNLYDLLSCYVYFASPSCEGTLLTIFFLPCSPCFYVLFFKPNKSLPQNGCSVLLIFKKFLLVMRDCTAAPLLERT